MFIGGGEPTLSWNLVEQATLYAEKTAKENNINLHKQLSTNGSILTPEMFKFYQEHDFEIQFSFDVIPEVQNIQRAQFDTVSANLKFLSENGIKCRIRSTVTDLNVDRMPEMVELCHTEYPKVNRLILEHVVDPEHFKIPEIIRDFYDRYFTSFIASHLQAKKYGIGLFSSSTGTVRAVREKFCFNLYCLTPYATFTTCPNISSPIESGYEDAVFGRIQNNEIIFDDTAYRTITSGDIHNNQKCRECWAKWNCGGGCPNQRQVYKSEIFDETCIYQRKILRYNLISELSGKYKKSTGKDMLTEIANILKK
jgi:radical SAM protein with 4Fe4S-binding SPASM domain